MTRFRLYRIEPCSDPPCIDPDAVQWCDGCQHDGTREVRTEVVVKKLPHWRTWYGEVTDAE